MLPLPAAESKRTYTGPLPLTAPRPDLVAVGLECQRENGLCGETGNGKRKNRKKQAEEGRQPGTHTGSDAGVGTEAPACGENRLKFAGAGGGI